MAIAISWSLPSSDSDGNFTISWSGGASYVEVYQQVEGQSNWSGVGAGGANDSLTLSRSDGRYFYRLRNCQVTGGPSGTTTSCSYTSSKTILISTTPPSTPSGFSVPSTNGTGSYTVSWNGQAGVTHYLILEQVNGGSFSTNSTGATSKSYNGKSPGTYGYRVRACNPAGCSGYIVTKSVQVLGATISYEYDELGRLIRVVDTENQETSYEYDAADNRTEKQVD